MAETPDTQMRKMAALNNFVEQYYVPQFVKTCQENGLTFDSPSELAHALQINGKLSSLVSSGVSIDALIDSVVNNLHVKHAAEGDLTLSLSSINNALDASLATAGIPVAPAIKAAAAEYAEPISEADIAAFLELAD